MKKFTKKILCIISCFLIASSAANADFAEHYNLAQQYLSQYQYSSAIAEFKKALRINYLDNSSRIGLINSYMARGTYFANKDRNWEGAANDYRAALFYAKYYPTPQDVQNSAQAISEATQNLNKCLVQQKFNTSAASRFQKGKELRLNGFFPEAGYEFAQALTDQNLRKNSYEQIADIFKVLGNLEKCSDYYQKAVALNPDNAGLRLKYAISLDKMGQNDQAVQEYNYALTNGGDDPEILFALERLYRQKLSLAPNDAPTITNLGAILQKQNKFDEALQYYTQASQLDPTNITTRLNVGTLYQQKQSYDSAIAAYDSILFLYPDNVQANLYKSQCLAAKGQNDLAAQGFKKVLSLDPSNKAAKSQIFDTMKSTMTPAEFMAYLSKNAATDKGAIDDMYDYAIELHKQKKLPDAILCYKEVLKLRTTSPEVYINLAIAYKEANNLAQAKQTLVQAKVKFPTNKQVSDNLTALTEETTSGTFDEASKLYNAGEYQKALTSYQTIQPPSFDSLSGIAACYKALNNDMQAIEYYKKAFDLSPDSDVAYYLGVLYSEKESWVSSKFYLKKALALNPSNTKVKDLLGSVIEQGNIKLVDEGIALYDKADYPKATAIFNRVLQDQPQNAYAHYYKGLILDAEKHYLPALGEYKKALSSGKDLTILYYLMALDYEALSQFKPALTNYKKYVSITTENNEYKTYAQSRVKALKKYE